MGKWQVWFGVCNRTNRVQADFSWSWTALNSLGHNSLIYKINVMIRVVFISLGCCENQARSCVCLFSKLSNIFPNERSMKPFKTPMLPMVTTLYRLAWGFPDMKPTPWPVAKWVFKKSNLKKMLSKYHIFNVSPSSLTAKMFWIESAAFRVLTKTVFKIKKNKSYCFISQLSLSSFRYEWGQAPKGAWNVKMN